MESPEMMAEQQARMAEQQESIAHRGVTFGVVTFLVAATILTVVGTVATSVEPTTPEDDTTPRRWRKVRGCFAYLTKRSANIPLWKSLLIKSAVTFVTTLGGGLVSLVISNVMATNKETIRETVAAILDIELGGERRRRSAGTEEDLTMGTAICTALGEEAEQAHCVTFILAIMVFVMVVVSPVFVVLATRLHSRFQQARGARGSRNLAEIDDDIQKQ